VAVKNRSAHSDETASLSSITSQEEQWFEERIPGYVKAEKASANQLIYKVTKLLCDYLVHQWAPATIPIVQSRLQQMRDSEIQQFGLPTEQMTHDKFWNHLCLLLKNFDSKFQFPKNLPKVSDFHLSLDGVRRRNVSKNAFFQAVSNEMRALAERFCVQILTVMSSDQKSPEMFSRFSKFRQQWGRAIDTEVQKLVKVCHGEIERRLQNYFEMQEMGFSTKYELPPLHIVQHVIMETVLIPLSDMFSSAQKLKSVQPPPGEVFAVLVEDSAHLQKRNLNKKKVTDLESALNTIGEISRGEI